MKDGGMEGLLQFLKYLNLNKVGYHLDHDRDESIMVTLTLLKHRIEVDFFVDHVEYSIFSGNESVQSDFGKLIEMIEYFVAG